tara:strand:+ start:757 stop:2301 length:1545 start_codon:yes stop_codon:yes gene_type:complete
VSEEKDKYLAMASLSDLGQFIPDIDSSSNIDLLPVAFNAFVVNRANKNGDVLDGPTTIATYKNFTNKPINIEHERQNVVGVILTAGFSEFGTDKPLSEEEVKGITGPYNVVLGGVIWRVVDNDLAGAIEESGDPESENYEKISASWELGFVDYEIAKIEGSSKNLEDGEMISDPTQIEELSSILKGFGGEGKKDGIGFYRKPVGDVLPLGIGFTASPAAEVKGIANKDTKPPKEKVAEKGFLENFDKKSKDGPKDGPEGDKKDKPEGDKKPKEGKKKEQETEKKDKSKNKVSQSSETNVKKNSKTIMKLSSIKDITDESLKTLEASSITDFIGEEIQKASEVYVQEKGKTDEALNLAKTQAAETTTKLAEMSEQLEASKVELKKLQNVQAEAARVESFNQRMSSLDTEFEISDEARKVIASQLKKIDSDEEFTAWKESMSVFLSAKKGEASEEEIAAEAKKEEARATLEEAKVVADSLKNGRKTNDVVPPNSSNASTTADKWAGALKEDDVIIK